MAPLLAQSGANRTSPMQAKKYSFIVAAVFCAAGPVSAYQQNGPSDVLGAVLQADGAKAMAILARSPASEWSEVDQAFGQCVRNRLGNMKSASRLHRPDRVHVRDWVLSVFRSYWKNALLSPENRAMAEADLLDALRSELGVTGGWAETEAVLKERLAAEGTFALFGQTGPLRELMMWTRQSSKTETVMLPEQAFQVRVIYLDGFISLGWTDWATCSRRGAGGWATQKALFAVVPRYKSLDSEEFRVTFLGHEAQHFADLAQFEDLKPWELEYRAKLVELSQVSATRVRVMQKFTEDRSTDPSIPHAYANGQVLGELTRRLGLSDTEALRDVGLEDLHRVAIEALASDTARRRKHIRP